MSPPKGHMVDLIKQLRRLINVPLSRVWSTVRFAWGKLELLDIIEERAYYLRPREVVRGSTTRALRKCLSIVRGAKDMEQLSEARNKVEEILASVPIDPEAVPLKVGLVGEIYVVLEPFANGEVAETLGELGVEVHRSTYLTKWTRENAFLDFFRIPADRDAKRLARPYLGEMIGGPRDNQCGGNGHLLPQRV